MTEAPTRFSGLFSRRKNVDTSASRSEQYQDAVPTIETTRVSAEDGEPRTITLAETHPTSERTNPEGFEVKSFFRMPRRRKPTQAQKNELDIQRHSTDRLASVEQARPSMSSIRSNFESFLRPSLTGRSSNSTLSPTMPASSAIVVATSSLAAQGSPRLEIANPLDARDISRQPSLRSVRSLRSTHSTPASDPSLQLKVDSRGNLPSRGRSLTYGGSDSQAKSNVTNRTSKFFSMGRLLRDGEDASLFRSISREISPTNSPRKPPVEKPIAPIMPGFIAGEAPHQYLARIEARTSKTQIASMLSTSDDPFHHECLQIYMQQFNFVDDPLDIALRKILMDSHLPKEAQQIDRVLLAFSARYQACNPRLYDNQVTPYVLSFALIMLHTDRFNQNNKNKMTKAQFIKNTRSEHTEDVSVEVLDYFYDNIVCTPFILVEDETECFGTNDRSGPPTPNELPGARNGSLSAASMAPSTGAFGRKSLELYPLIMENRLQSLRPQIGQILEDDHAFTYTGTLPVINIVKLHKAFTNPATLQLVSARSRPEAFASDHSIQNPLASDPGLVEIQITKIGILRRKEQKKAGSKPVYREWGVMLTPSQLLLFKNVAWVKQYMSQARDQLKPGPLVLSPPVHNFSPDSYMPTSDTVAIYDPSISKKPTYFCFFGRGGEQTHLIASSEDEMNDWVAKINYASAFHTVGIRIRGIAENQNQSDNIKRMNRQHSRSALSISSATNPNLSELMFARQGLLRTKIHEIEDKVQTKEHHLALLQQQARNLCTLTPIQPRTRTSIISAAGSLSAKLSWARVELVKSQCHRDILSKDLALEIDPNVSAFTTPNRSMTPPPGSIHSKNSPSKPKLGSVMGSLMRQVSTDTMKRVTRQFSHADLHKTLDSSSIKEDKLSQHSKSRSEIDSEYIKTLDLSPEALNGMFVDVPVEGGGPARSSTMSNESEISLSHHSKSPPVLKLNTLFGKLGAAKGSRESSAVDDSSVLSSPDSGQSPNKFILHGRKVSLVQTPINLHESTAGHDVTITGRSSMSSDESQEFQDAPEHPQ